MPTHDGHPVLTTGKANACQKIIDEWLAQHGVRDPGRLYNPGHEGPYWCYSLEGGPDEWAILISRDRSVTWPRNVWVEPATHWCLALHPA